MGHPKTNDLLYIYIHTLYFLTSVNHWNHVLEITRDGFTWVDRQQNDVHWYQASPRPSESPGRAGQQVKEDDVGTSPDQEHDQKGTCAEAQRRVAPQRELERDLQKNWANHGRKMLMNLTTHGPLTIHSTMSDSSTVCDIIFLLTHENCSWYEPPGLIRHRPNNGSTCYDLVAIELWPWGNGPVAFGTYEYCIW